MREFVRSNPYHAWPGASIAARDAVPAEDSPGVLMRRAAAAFGLRPVGQGGGHRRLLGRSSDLSSVLTV